MTMSLFNEKLADIIKYDEKGLIPVVVQEAENGKVLMLAYMNREALQKTIETGLAHYYSRSRGSLWKKGETSGHIQKVLSITPDCDNDSLLIRVRQKKAACHTGHYSCFFNEYDLDGGVRAEEKVFDPEKVYEAGPDVLNELFEIIMERKNNPREGSYTCYLFEKGLDKILKKVGEECSEVIIASKNESRSELVYEIADLFYHILVLVSERDLKPEDIYNELKKRRR